MNDFYKQAIDFWKNKNFNESLNLFENLFKENEGKVIKIIEQEKIYQGENSIYFWKSNLLENNFFSFFEDYHQGYYFLKEYFKQKQSSISLIENLIKKKEELLLEVIKNLKIQTASEHFKLIFAEAVKLNSKKIIKTLNEMAFLEKAKNDLESEIFQKQDVFLKKFSIQQLVMTLGIYFENERLQNRKENLVTLDWSPSISDLISKIINRYKEMNQDKIINNEDLSIDEMNKIYLECILNLQKDTSKINDLISDFETLESFEQAMDFYYYYDWEIDFSLNPPELKPVESEKHKLWIKNGFKYKHKHIYNIQFAQTLPQSEQIYEHFKNSPDDFEMNQRLCQFKLSYYLSKLPEEILFKEETSFSSEEYFFCMEFLAMYSRIRYLKPVHQNTYYNSKSRDYEELLYLIQENSNSQCVIFRKIEDQVKNIFRIESKPVSLTKDKIKSIYKIGSSDLIGNFKINLEEKPLMKLGGYYIFFAFPISNRDYSVCLTEIIEKEILSSNSKIKFDTKKWTGKYEEYISELFRTFNYNSKFGLKYGINDNEIDIIAYKDKTFFIIELKMTHTRIENHSVLDHRRSALLKGGVQLEKAVSYLETEAGKKEIADKISINEKDIERIYPILITNSFEDDYYLISDKFRKITLFELERILINDKFFMFKLEESILENDSEAYQQHIDFTKSQIVDLSLNQKLKEKLNSKKEFDNPRKKFSLRKDNEEPSPDYIIDCVENDKVWSELKNEDDGLKERIIPINGVDRIKFYI